GPARRLGVIPGGDRDGDPDAIAREPVTWVEIADDDGRCVDRGEPVMERLRPAGQVEQAIRLPVDVAQLRDDVAGDRRMPSQLRDLVAQGFELVLLGRTNETRNAVEHAIVAERLDARC